MILESIIQPMDSLHKKLIKLIAYIETYQSPKFSFKCHYYQESSALFCLVIDSTSLNKDEEHFSCSFFFDCYTKIIYLDDYGTIYSGQSSLTSEKELKFTLLMQEVIRILTQYDLGFKMFQTTTRINEYMDFLVNVGFEKKEQLNHYGNTKFVMTFLN